MEARATILHADLDAFYASVEQLLDPPLLGRPIAVGGGVVLAASYEAKAFGVGAGMPGWRARQLCPGLVFVGGHFREYQRLADRVIDVLGDFTPLVRRLLGDAPADKLGSLAVNDDPRRIETSRTARSVGAQSALGRRPATPELLRTVFGYLVDRVAGRLRAAGLAGRTVTVRVRF